MMPSTEHLNQSTSGIPNLFETVWGGTLGILTQVVGVTTKMANTGGGATYKMSGSKVMLISVATF